MAVLVAVPLLSVPPLADVAGVGAGVNTAVVVVVVVVVVDVRTTEESAVELDNSVGGTIQKPCLIRSTMAQPMTFFLPEIYKNTLQESSFSGSKSTDPSSSLTC